LTGIRSARAYAAAFTVALSVAAVNHAAAQARSASRVDGDWVFDVRYLKLEDAVALSPDDSAIAITVEDRRRKVTPSGRWQTPTGVATYYEGCTITVIEIRTHRATQITPHANSWAPSWSPDGGRLAFFSDRGGTVGVWIWDRRTRASRRLVARVPAMVTRPEWAGDGRKLLLLTTSGSRRTSELSKRPSLVEVFRSHAGAGGSGTSFDPASVKPFPMAELVIVDAQTGRAQVLARGPILGATLSPDGRHAAYAIERDAFRPGSPQYAVYGDIVVVRTDTPTVTSVLHDIRVTIFPQLPWSPDGRQLAVGQEDGIYFLRADDSTVTAHAIASDTPSASLFSPLSWKPDGSGVYVAFGRSVAFASSRDGTVRRLATLDADILTFLNHGDAIAQFVADSSAIAVMAAEDSGQHSSFRVINVATGSVSTRLAAEREYGFGYALGAQRTTAAMKSGAVVFVAESASEPPDVWIANDSLTHEEPLTRLNSTVLSAPLGERRVITWAARDGHQVKGLLLTPPRPAPSGGYPLIVWAYQRSLRNINNFGLGGDQFFNLQQFALLGYAVLYPDVEWDRDSVLAGLGDQVLPGIDSLIAGGAVDSAKIGLVGHSSGGYDVLALLVQSTRFAAAVESSGWGAADLFSMYTTEITGTVGYDWVEKQMGLGAPPWEAPDRYVRNSPGYFLNRVRTPLLILQGPVDDQLGEKQSEQVFSGLRRLGKEVEFRRYPGEGHAPEWWTPAAKQDAHRRMLEWLDSYLHPSLDQAKRP
jgi:dipeptidyl aminopeptidase/acylaminoacyl peptidase